MLRIQDERTRALALLVLMPLFFSSNIVLGRAAVGEIEPWTLSFLRWSLAFLVLLPFAWRGLVANFDLFVRNWIVIGTLGLLGMWVCGALVYLALKETTATNGTLIYTSTPVLIILLEWLFRGRPIRLREASGIIVAVLGVLVIVMRGDFGALIGLRLNWGDLLFAVCAFAWAVYSVVLKREVFASVPTLSLFAIIAFAGALTLAPFMVWESILVDDFPSTTNAWASIVGIVLFSSVLAFGTYQYGVRVVGPAVTGVFLYMLPLYGVFMAVLFLGEELHGFHFAGCSMVLGGVILATAPLDRLRSKARLG